jgi:acetaldehyde dehydrogenase (acetylating)
MTLGCGSWGGNVTSDNISPLHLMDIKRVAFETRPVASKRPAQAADGRPAAASPQAPLGRAPQPAAAQGQKISREEVASIVDRFLAGRGDAQPSAPLRTELHPTASAPPAQSPNEINPNWIDSKSAAAPHAEAAPTAREAVGGGGGNGGGASTQTSAPQQQQPAPKPAGAAGNGGGAMPAANGHKAVDFVSEDDVRRAVQRGEKIYVNAKTIITPSAHDIGDPAEVFAKI